MDRRVILVGAGGFGATWATALARAGARVVAVVDRDPKIAHEAGRKFGLQATHVHGADGLSWANTEADWIIDSAPPEGRKERLAAALATGKDCIAAKPVVLRLAELAELQAAEQRTGKRVLVAMQKRYFPAFRALRDLHRAGRLGQVEYVGIQLEVDGTVWTPGFDWRRGLDNASLVEGAIHHLDLVHWLLDAQVESVVASAWRSSWSPFSERCDFAATLHCRGNLVVHYLSRWGIRGGGVSHYFSGLRLEGSGGTAEVKDGKLFLDGVYVPVEADGQTAMDLERLNCDFLEDAFRPMARIDSQSSFGLVAHERVLRSMLSISDAIQRSTSGGTR